MKILNTHYRTRFPKADFCRFLFGTRLPNADFCRFTHGAGFLVMAASNPHRPHQGINQSRTLNHIRL